VLRCTGTPDSIELETKMNQNLETRGWYNIRPKGTIEPGNDNRGFGFVATPFPCDTGSLVNDVEFFKKIVETVREDAKFEVDMDQIYLVGFSNGASMVLKLMCEVGHLFAGSAIHAPGLAPQYLPSAAECFNYSAKPHVAFCGTGDVFYMGIPYGIRFEPGGTRPMPNHVDAYSAANGCGAEETVTLQNESTLCKRKTNCAVDGRVTTLEWCTIEGLGHIWPGSDCCESPEMHDRPVTVVDGTAHLLDFFAETMN
jgi:poly(3-hydroxybutyrate) depolymerase